MCVLEIDVGISVRREHSVVIEDIVTESILTKIEVLDTTVAKLVCCKLEDDKGKKVNKIQESESD